MGFDGLDFVGNFIPAILSQRPVRIIITGTSGLIGGALARALHAQGEEVVSVNRRVLPTDRGLKQLNWDFSSPLGWEEELRSADAVVHLAGASIAAGRWTAARKALIKSSRIESTRRLARTLVRFKETGMPCPKTFVVASAIGYYGDRGDEWMDERSSKGDGFLADLCAEWEAEALQAAAAGIRTVCCRFGMVVSGRGGALPKLAPLFRFFMGGRLGKGEQFWSWIGLEDTVGALRHCLLQRGVSGPVNFVAPGVVTNREFTECLAQTVHRPGWLTVPPFALRLVTGEMAEALLLASARVKPATLLESGYRFTNPDLASGIRAALADR